MRDIFISSLLEEAKNDSRIILVTGDLGFKVFDQFREILPNQFINAGVAEQNMTGIAAGMALEGKIVFTYSIANFPTLRCLEQIRNSACYHQANVKIVSVGAGFSYGALGISHHATEDISIMRALPQLEIYSPGCDWEAYQSTKSMIRRPGTAYLRLDRSSAGNTQNPGEQYVFGRNRVLRNGDDLTIIVTGGILQEVLESSEVLAAEDISVRVINVHTIKPFDSSLIIQAARETAGLIIVEEHTVDGGLGSLVAENLLEQGCMPGFFIRMGLRSEFSSVVGSQEYLREQYCISKKYIIEKARSAISEQRSKVLIDLKSVNA